MTTRTEHLFFLFDLPGDTDANDVDESSSSFLKVEQDLDKPIDGET